MFCKHCGSQIPDGSEKCPSCGGSLTGSAASPASFNSANSTSVKELADNFTNIAAERTAGLPLGLIAKVCILIALVTFFLPFVSVSCKDNEYASKMEEKSYSGFTLMLDLEDDDDESLDSLESDPKPNIFLILAFAGGVATAVFIFYKKKYKLAAMISGASAIALILFRMTFFSYYDLPSESKKYIDIDTKFGLLLCILMMLTTAAACFLEDKNSQSGSSTL
ncbi:MAG: zinc-ribbon domain-containing protein [Ruminococcus sp.]|uniref:zinc-ribbon domain-containing protein n=1 Tax=Ruminococcus sp. TaxID=41978 RepID=UPI0025D3ECE5|nr:zinc-ribbon domain-containing protein [Ruminococcus sp.]MCR4795843.1 zinc-ribbon domain-containing protein [Ruminococcus sp.]